MNRAVFVDRDGTIARNVPYCSRSEDFELLPTVGEGIKLLNDTGIKVVVITNQSGIARGYFTEETLQEIHNKMKLDLASVRAHVDAIYYCPHHPNEHCQCRKPNIGLFKSAASDLEIDLRNSYYIGDRLHDMEAANKAGCRALLVPSQDTEINLLHGEKTPVNIDIIFPNFYASAEYIVNRIKRQTEEYK